MSRSNSRIESISCSACYMPESLQRISLLQQVDAQHRLHRIRRPTHATRTRVIWLDPDQWCLPWHYLVHLVKENLAPGLLALAQALRIPKCQPYDVFHYAAQ